MLQEIPDDKTDDITGSPVEDVQLKEDTDQILKVLQQGEAFRELVATKGWKILNEFIEGQVKSLTISLKVEKDFSKIIRIQSELLAFESLLLIIEQSFLDYEEAVRRTKQHIGDPQG